MIANTPRIPAYTFVLCVVACVLASVPALAEVNEADEEAALEADMAQARERVRELRERRASEQEATTWQAHIDFPARGRVRVTRHRPRPAPVYVDVAPCPRCSDELPLPRKRSTFYAEPRAHWTLIGGRSSSSAALSIGGLVRERLQIGAIVAGSWQRGGPDGTGDLWLANGGIDTSFFVVSHRFFRLGLGGAITAGAYGLRRDGGMELSSVFSLEPRASVEFRPLTWLAIGADGGYRFAWSHREASLGYGALSGPYAGAFIRLGL